MKSRNSLAGAIGALLLSSMALANASGISGVDLLPATESSWPFFSAAPLDSFDYEEREYLVSGVGSVFAYSDDGGLTEARSGQPYATRLLVRTPRRAESFNGVVVFEMLNPSATFDVDFIWKYADRYFMQEGYVWVGLTIRDDAIGFLKNWNAERYADLSLADNGLTYAIFGELARIFRNASHPQNPLSGFRVEVLLGAGFSQSDDWLTTFSNEFHDLKNDDPEKPLFDGYLGVAGNGAARAINSADQAVDALYEDERRYNRVAAPYFRVHTESELEVFSASAAKTRQPDSPRFRQWEIAGTSHIDRAVALRVGETMRRDLGGPLPECERPLGTVSLAPFVRSAIAHLVRWTRDGLLPPASRSIELDDSGAIRRDRFGNARGGVRTPEVAAPLASFGTANAGPRPCGLTGSVAPLPDDVELPPDSERNQRFGEALRDLENDGYLLPGDARAYVNPLAG